MKKGFDHIRHFKGSVLDFKTYFDVLASETSGKPENTNATDTPVYQSFGGVHPVRGARKSPHWDKS